MSRSLGFATLLKISVLSAALVLVACGSAHLVKKGDEFMRQGRHDAAIAQYERAVTASQGDPKGTNQAASALQKARLSAAHHHLAKGDNHRDQRHLREAGKEYKKAASYVPTNQDVVQRQSNLLKRRLRIEQDIEQVNQTLARLQPRGTKLKDLQRWLELARLVEGLQNWRHDYPNVVDLYQRVAAPAAMVLLKDAKRAMGVEDFDHAQVQIQRAMRLQPGDKQAQELLQKAAMKGNADKLAKKGNVMLESGDTQAAVGAFEDALKRDPNSYAARQGVREAKRRYVETRLAAVKKHLKKREHKRALIAIIDATAMGTDYPNIAKELEKYHKSITARAAKQFYDKGRKYENKALWGAALLAFRTAGALGNGPKDVSRRVEKAQRKVADLRLLKLYAPKVVAPKGSAPNGATVLEQRLRDAIAKSNLPSRGIVLVDNRRLRKTTQGSLSLTITRLTVNRTEKQDARRKKYLDRVEFRSNPRYALAQSTLSATLASMNAATDELRPVQEQLNASEVRLTKLDAEFTKLKDRILSEDGAYYQNKPAPCPNGTTDCKESYANRRWAKHLAYYRDHIAKTNGSIATLSPRYSELRDKVARITAEFHAAEKLAHETPDKLREEIWLDYSYTVALHEVKFGGEVALTWMPAKGKKPVAVATAKVDDHQVDFSTPGVIVKEQTLEPQKASKLADDAALLATLSDRLVTELEAKMFPNLQLQGMRFVQSADAQKKAEKRLHQQVLALASGDAIDSTSRRRFTGDVLAAAGWNWDRMEIDTARLPYK